MAERQALVIGLGQFGMAVASALAARGIEVIAVDRKLARVQLAAEFAADAVTMDATDENQLARLGPGRRDLCVCTVGDDSREASILVTALLRQMGARRVIARAADDLHARILHLVGAHEVVNPERIYGERLAARLASRGVVDSLSLGDALVISELVAPTSIVGRSLAELALPERHQLTVVAVRRSTAGEERVLLPSAGVEVASDDVLVLVGPVGAAEQVGS